MNTVDERDLDLNLLRVLVVVADEGSVTRAAARLYLTQPAVSAALRRLRGALGASLFAKQGRGIALTPRGRQVVEAVRPHLRALLDAARGGGGFDPATAALTLRLGMSDDVEFHLLAPLVARLRAEAPGARVVVIPVQFRTVNDALARQSVDLAVTVADEAPRGVAREALGTGRFACVYDPKAARLSRPPTRAQYESRAHVAVSYNGDLRGIVEDATDVRRRVVCAVARFANLGPLLVGSDLVATVPDLVAARLVATHPTLRAAPLPFELPATPLEMLWNESAEGESLAWLRGLVRDAYRSARRARYEPRAPQRDTT